MNGRHEGETMKRKSLTEKFLYKDEYFSEMLDKEREYRACASGNKCDTPFVTPLLHLLYIRLGVILVLLSSFLGALLTLVVQMANK